MRCLVLFLGLFFYSLSFAQDHLSIQQVEESISLNETLSLLDDPNGDLSIEAIIALSDQGKFVSLSYHSHSLDPTHTWWIHLRLNHDLSHTHRWMLHGSAIGMAELYLVDETGSYEVSRSGRNMPASEKVENQGEFLHFPLELKQQSSYDLFLRVWEIDHQPIHVTLFIQDEVYWRSKTHIRLESIILFFMGIFAIMALYNFVLYGVIRFPAYFYYGMYLMCVGGFVLFAVGPMSHPSFGNPRWLVPIGHLAFGSINIFYYLFGRSFLNLKELLPQWDLWIKRYIYVKAALIFLAQIELYTFFHVPLALSVEFSLLLIDVVVSLFFFRALWKTRDRLAYYFIGGSGSVIVIGLSLAVLGHLFPNPNTFVIFLSTIIIEIIFFSLGLGYRIRLTEQQKLEAERARRLAQEALNEELSKYNEAFKRFVPHEFLRSLGHKNVLDVGVGDGVEKRVTVLFSDIRGYTSLSEQMSPKENFDFLNTYLGLMGPIIQAHHGFVNQYYGDGIMALFLDHPENALQAALQMLEDLNGFNQERLANGEEAIRIGIGLHTGPLMMGVLGDMHRMDAGVVSDTVNTAARMEGLTKHYRTELMLSEQTWSEIPDSNRYLIRFLGKVQVKGKQAPLGVYECTHVSTEEKKSRYLDLTDTFAESLTHYFAKEFKEAHRLLQHILSEYPEDHPTRLYVDQVERNLRDGVSDSWEGVESMMYK